MAGIYLHIPFCKRKCNYCNFFSVASLKKARDFSRFLIQELRLRREFTGKQPIETVYFGGGTPSLLNSREIADIVNAIDQHFTLRKDAEITLEANPDDLNPEYLAALSETPVNRLSIGIQSFHDQDLTYLDRIHDKAQCYKSLEYALNAGLENLSIDLIYGIPGQTDDMWETNLRTASELNIRHVSAYWLTVEAKTALNAFIEKGKIPAPDENTGLRHFRILRSWAAANAYEHYEISNLCKDGHYARHNTAYWQSVPYLGIGPSAHSFDGKARYSNVSSIDAYKNGLEEGIPAMSKEILSREDQYNEYLMTGLRTIWGVEEKTIVDRFGAAFGKDFRNRIREFKDQNLVSEHQGTFRLSEEGMLLSDFIISRLFIV